ncbi:hypothetical protein ACC715_37495, partial [Rhizobium ruizarguesonis]
LIVSGLMLAAGMSMINAIGTSLLSVCAFGLATSLNYASSGLVDWWLGAELTGSGIVPVSRDMTRFPKPVIAKRVTNVG